MYSNVLSRIRSMLEDGVSTSSLQSVSRILRYLRRKVWVGMIIVLLVCFRFVL